MAVAFWCLVLNASLGQEIGAYRSVASGNYGNINIWEIFDGTVWSAASIKPGQTNDIYIDVGHLVTLTGDEEAKSVFINAQASAGEKLNLNGNNLDIYGSLQGFDGAAPGIPNRAWNSINWIGNSITSTLTFKGNSRAIIKLDTWTGQSDRSRYSVVFDPGPSVELIIEEAFKALSFTIKSGSVYQKIDNNSAPSKCPTFSFNTETTIYGSGDYGEFHIEPGAKLVSDCDSDILFRSASLSAALFDLQSGGELILEGTSPQIEAANFQLNGKVTFNKNSGTQNFISKSFASSVLPLKFHDLEIQGSQNVTLPPAISVTGNITQSGTGQFQMNNTHLTFEGAEDQIISGFALNPQDLTVNKSGGEVAFDQNLTVLRNLSMQDGKLNFQNNTLTINTSSDGTLDYQGGSWENLTSFTYANAPTSFEASNATFPFGDRYHGGIRKVQMLGTNAGGDLTIDYTEYNGADFNPGFSDSDATPILYRLFSYFNFSGLNSSSNPLELRISAKNLIVDEPEDLRLVCTGYAAPGTHIESSDTDNLWAIRSLTFDDLSDKNFTVGSFRTLSILPVTWLSVSAQVKGNSRQITWSVASEKDNEKFEIYTSENGLENWLKIGEIPSQGNSETPTFYSFKDENYSQSLTSYYQIRVVDFFGQESWSEVVRLEGKLPSLADQLTIYPNPHSMGKIWVSLPETFKSEYTQVSINSTQGALISSFSFSEVRLSDKLQEMNPGVYIITFSNTDTSIQTRWIKR
uniref:T9SS type A sorting domain-containing protein n=1 Tax=Algoriphagus locisalis TaxID=305507 RepID=UPI00147D55A0|nr:T9SS type A sorting domain-containing protein [Algoriphagus locisalis]